MDNMIAVRRLSKARQYAPVWASQFEIDEKFRNETVEPIPQWYLAMFGGMVGAKIFSTELVGLTERMGKLFTARA